MRRFGLKEFSFLHALLLSLMFHSLLAVRFITVNDEESDIRLDAAPGQARMRFSFSKKPNGIGNAKPEAQEEENDGEQSAEVDPGILTSEISNIMREIQYPALAVNMGMQGTVVYQIRTDAEGRVAEMTLIQSSGFDLLDRTAENRLRRWTFPFRSRSFKIPVRFVLK